MNNTKYLFVLIGSGYYNMNILWKLSEHMFGTSSIPTWKASDIWHDESLPVFPTIYDFTNFFHCTICPRLLDTIFCTLQLLFCLILPRNFKQEEKNCMLHLIKFRNDKNLELGNECVTEKIWSKYYFRVRWKCMS